MPVNVCRVRGVTPLALVDPHYDRSQLSEDQVWVPVGVEESVRGWPNSTCGYTS